VAIAWLLDQEGVMAIPKAGRPESQKANLDALGISLDHEDRAAIAALPKDQRFVRPPIAPEWDAVCECWSRRRGGGLAARWVSNLAHAPARLPCSAPD
jgi:hypothetical protein